MKKYMVIYHAPAEAMAKMGTASQEEKEAGMKAWYDWKNSVGGAVTDFGNPLVGGVRVLPDGSTQQSTKEVAGYSILQAENMDVAQSFLKSHPHLAWSDGCDIEIYECVDMGSGE